MKTFCNTFTKMFVLSLALTLVFNTGLFAQKWVSTNVEKRNVLLEEFTGIHCGYCPDGHKIANDLVTANPGKIFLVNIHAGGYAVPAAGEPDLRTPEGTAIDGKSGLNGYPAGSVNRSKSPWASDRGKWGTEAKAIMALNSPVNVAVKSSVDLATGVLNTEVEAYYTADVSTTQYITIVLVQDNILGPQSDYGNYNPTNWVGTQYRHNHVLRTAITAGGGTAAGAWGEVIPTTKSGTLFTKTFTTNLPAAIAGQKFEFHNLYVVAFVSDYQNNVSTVSGDKVSFDPALFTDLGMKDLTVYPTTLKVTGVNPKVDVTNNSGKDITSFDIIATVNGVDSKKSFAGTLKKGDKTTIDWGTIAIDPKGYNTMSINGFTNLNGSSTLSDMDLSNNSTTTNFIAFKEKAFTTLKAGFDGNIPYNLVFDQSANANFTITTNPVCGANASSGAVRYALHSSWGSSGKPGYIMFGELDLTGATTTSLSYYYAYSDGKMGGTAPKIKTQVSEDWGLSWKEINSTTCVETGQPADANSWYVPTSAAYKQVVVDISAYYNKTIIVRVAGIPGTHGNALYIDELNVGVVVKGQEISSVTKLDFGKVNAKTILPLEITNTGGKNLTIFSGMVENDANDAFLMESAIYGTIKPGDKKTFSISVTPKAKKIYTAKLTISSDATNNSEYSIDLTAEGVGTSVDDGIAGDANVMTMSAGPNPFASTSTLTYTVNGIAPRNVEINVIDASGKIVANLVKSNVAPGVYTTSINANNLTSGSYFVVSNVDGVTSQLPVVIAK